MILSYRATIIIETKVGEPQMVRLPDYLNSGKFDVQIVTNLFIEPVYIIKEK